MLLVGSSSALISYWRTDRIRGTRIMLNIVAAQPYYLLLHGHDEMDKNNTDGAR